LYFNDTFNKGNILQITNKIRKILSIAITTIVSFGSGFYIAFFFFEHKNRSADYSWIRGLQENNALFNCCQPGRRELAFLLKGGEYLPDYKNPRTLNDKIAYIFDNYFQKSPVMLQIGNKYLAKKYVSKVVGEEHTVKLLGVWDQPNNIEWNLLPEQFVLKTIRGHCGRQVIIVRDKSKIDIAKITRQLEEFCKIPFVDEFALGGKRIIAEEYLDPQNEAKKLIDYKFFCSYGKAFLAYCCFCDREDTCDVNYKTFSLYSVPGWKRYPVTFSRHNQNLILAPKNLTKMIEIAEKLSKPFPLIRIDLYEVGDRVLVGELTEDSGGAKNILFPTKYDFEFGELFNVPTLEEIDKMIENDKKKYGNLVVGSMNSEKKK
jgi:hypothetical protein